MNVTTAKVRPGASGATFTITLPHWTGLTSTNKKCLGKPRHLSFNNVEPKDIHYSLNFRILHNKPTFKFYLNTKVDPTNDNSAAKVGEKLDKHFTNVDRQWPILTKLPCVYYMEDNDEYPHFVVELPPRTAVYSSSKEFFAGLGFGLHDDLQRGYKPMAERGTNVSLREVFGFFNAGMEAKVYEAKTMRPNSTMQDWFADGKIPPFLFVQVEFLDTYLGSMGLQSFRRAKYPASKRNAIPNIISIIERIRNHSGLMSNPFLVEAGPGETFSISNRAIEHSGITVEFYFNEDMAEAFGVDSADAMIFPLEATRTFTFSIRSTAIDPFLGRYPVLMKSSAFGSAVSYVDGIDGYQPIMAVINEMSDRYPIITNGLVFDTDKTYLTVEFYDKNKQLVVFTEAREMSILFTFQSL
jgi:hypothetical protein